MVRLTCPCVVLQILEYVPGGDFFSMLSRGGAVSEERAVLYVAELVLALESLHRHGVVYR